MHCCYCSDDADATVAFLDRSIGLSARATSKGIRADGSPLGIERTVESDVCLVYDARGGRISPAIEVHGWIDPPAVGEPYADPTNIGVQAVGVAVPTLDDTLGRLMSDGASVVGRTDDDPLALGGPTAIVRGPDGVTFDVVERRDVRETRLAHLRVTCAELTRSVEWYAALGWSLVEEPRDMAVDGALLGLGPRSVAGTVARLRLPDEELCLQLVEWSEPASHGAPYECANHRGLYRLALGVEDTRAATQELVDAGWAPTAPPDLIELPGTKVPDMWIAFFADPDGIVVQLVERARDAFASAAR